MIIVPTKRDTLGIVSKQYLLATPPTEILKEREFNSRCFSGLIDDDFIKNNYTKLNDLNWQLISCNENLTCEMANLYGHKITWKNVITFAKPDLNFIKMHLSHFDIADILFYRREVLDDDFIDSIVKSTFNLNKRFNDIMIIELVDITQECLYGFKQITMLKTVKYKDYVLLSGRGCNCLDMYHFIKIDYLIKKLNEEERFEYAKYISLIIDHLKSKSD